MSFVNTTTTLDAETIAIAAVYETAMEAMLRVIEAHANAAPNMRDHLAEPIGFALAVKGHEDAAESLRVSMNTMRFLRRGVVAQRRGR